MNLEAFKNIHEWHVNNPRINPSDKYYKDNMILLVQQKSNWHLYYDSRDNSVYSIAVIPGAESSFFGNVSYFRRWYRWKKRNSKKTMLCLTDKAIELLEL